jgi:hypothetical protein
MRLASARECVLASPAMRTPFLFASFVALSVPAFLAACSSDDANSGATGSSSSGGGAARACYQNTDITKCECVAGSEERDAKTWARVTACDPNVALDRPVSCSKNGDTCSCDLVNCYLEDPVTPNCACGTVAPQGWKRSEQTVCVLKDWCCTSADGTSCHCGTGSPACAAGESQTAADSCNVTKLKLAAGKLAKCE